MLSKLFGSCVSKKAVAVKSKSSATSEAGPAAAEDAVEKGSKNSTVDTTASVPTWASELLGSKLLVKKGKEDSTDELLSTGKNNLKAVALYFSAHWCPPCRGFTPKLADFYKKNLKQKGLEIVFVSSDRDEKAFASYFAEMPWLALPFSQRSMKAALSEKFGVSGIPALVVLDAQTGEVITKNGRAAVMEDPVGANLPWKPEPLSAILEKISAVAGDDFCRDNSGKKYSYAQACKGKKLAIYFSAHWCPPCRRFTPELAKWYASLMADGKGDEFELVFCSGDRDQKSFEEYFETMPWKAIPFGTEQKAMFSSQMAQRLEVSGIPHLVILDETHDKILCADGVASVYADLQGKKFPYA